VSAINVWVCESDVAIEQIYAKLEDLASCSSDAREAMLAEQIAGALQGFMGIEREMLAPILPRLVQRTPN
jgi:hypothetical protein